MLHDSHTWGMPCALFPSAWTVSCLHFFILPWTTCFSILRGAYAAPPPCIPGDYYIFAPLSFSCLRSCTTALCAPAPPSPLSHVVHFHCHTPCHLPLLLPMYCTTLLVHLFQFGRAWAVHAPDTTFLLFLLPSTFLASLFFFFSCHLATGHCFHFGFPAVPHPCTGFWMRYALTVPHQFSHGLHSFCTTIVPFV